MKKYLLVLFLVIFITPSIVFASWWNPFSWKIFKKSLEIKIEQPVVIPPSNPINTPTTPAKVLKKIAPTSVKKENIKTTTIKEDEGLKIAKCQSVLDIKLLNIETEIDKQLMIELNDLGLLKKTEDYLLDISNLEIQRKNLLQQLFSNSSYGFELKIQAIEKEIIEKKNYLVFLNNTIDKIKKDPEIINKLKNTYFEEYNKCLTN